MAGPFDLTGVNIEDSYQRILQTPDGINIYDGTGSAFTVTAVAAPAGPNQSIQFNDNGTTSGSANFIFNKTTNAVSLTGSLYLAGTTPSIYFSGSDAASRLTWNDVDGTLNLGLKGGVVSSELGQGLVTRVVNKTSPLVDLLAANYQVVVIGGAQGQRLSVRLAQADNDANSAGTLGIVAENIDRNQEGFVITVGLLKNRNTTGALQGETWNDGDILYLSPTVAGRITNIKPQAPQHTVIVGYVEYAHQNNGKIYVKIDNGYELDELHNVRITTASLAAGQFLIRSGSNNGGVWINSNQLTGSYGLTGSLTFVSGGLTGSLFGTSSYALTASYVDLSGLALNSESLGTTPIVVVAATTAVLPRTPFYNNGTAGVGAFLSASLVGTLGNIDGVSLTRGDTLLVKNQAAQLQNGIYEVISTGSASTRYLLSRSLFSDETSEFDPQVILVASGSSNRGLVYSQNTNNPVVGTSPIVYLQQIGVFMTQVGTGTQNEYQIPWYTTTARQLSRGSSNFRYINVTSGTTVTTSSLVLTGSLFVTGGISQSGGTGHILTYDTQSGRFSFTASSAIGGGGSGVTINNNVDNYVLTATGVANTIQGEPNFSFSGSTLTVSGSTIISGSGLVVSGSIQVDGGITGSLFGTSSWAESASVAISSSYSDTASYALNGLPPGTSGQILQIDNSNQYQLQTLINDIAAVTSIDFENRTLNNDNGNILIDYGRYGQLYDLSGVESMNFGDLRTLSDSGGVLSIHYESRTLNDISGLSSIDYANRILYYPDGTTSAISYGTQNQVNITGSVTATGGFTGSLLGTASYAATASNILGGKAPHVPYFITDTTLATSSIYQSGSTSVIINLDVNTTANPEALYVYQPHPTSFNVISGKGDLNNYLQLNIHNTSTGTSASSDVVATANNGDENGNYIDMGINGSNFSGPVGNANDAYLYTTGSHLHIGNASPNKPIQFFAGGFDTDANRKLELNSNNQHNMTGSLSISGSLAINGLTSANQANVVTIDASTGQLYYTASSAFGGGTGTSITLRTNGTNNGSQTILNLKTGSNVTLVDDGIGGITISSTGGGPGGDYVTTSSFNSYTGSNSSTFAGTAATASYSLNFNIAQTLTLDATLTDYSTISPSTSPGPNNLFTLNTGSYTSAFGKYTIFSGSNSRAGEFVTSWNDTTTSYYDNSTVDIGDTSAITFVSSIISGQIQVNTGASTPSGWQVKMLATFM